MLCVHYTFFRNYLSDDMWRIMEGLFNASVSGIGNRKVALDGLMEKINKMAKTMMRGKVSKERIAAVVPTLNVLMPIEQAYGNAVFAYDRRNAYRGAPDLTADSQLITGMLHAFHATTYARATAASDENVLSGRNRDNTRVPRDHVVASTADQEEYVQGHADRLRV